MSKKVDTIVLATKPIKQGNTVSYTNPKIYVEKSDDDFLVVAPSTPEDSAREMGFYGVALDDFEPDPDLPGYWIGRVVRRGLIGAQYRAFEAAEHIEPGQMVTSTMKARREWRMMIR